MFIYSCSQTIKTIDLKKIIIAENANIWICPPHHTYGTVGLSETFYSLPNESIKFDISKFHPFKINCAFCNPRLKWWWRIFISQNALGFEVVFKKHVAIMVLLNEGHQIGRHFLFNKIYVIALYLMLPEHSGIIYILHLFRLHG
jgi:hypothetical protein